MSLFPAPGPVLHPTDGSDGARAAYPYALYLAALFGTGLEVLHVEEADGDGSGGVNVSPSAPAAEEHAREWIAATRERSSVEAGDGGRTLPEVRRVTRAGEDPADGILAHAEEIGAGAVCMGTHGRTGLRRLVLGSISEGVIREARCPVLTVRQGLAGWGEDGPGRLLVAADLSPMTRPALAWAGLIAAATGAELEAVHVITSTAAAADSGKRQAIHAAFEDLDLPEVELDTRVLAGDPGARIRGYAEERAVDLVIAATHGRSGPARLVFGSVAESLVRGSPCPVFTVSDPPPGVGPSPDRD